MPSLRRDRDGMGDSGARVEAYDTKGNVVGHKPMEGYRLLVGSVSARTYSHQDWWLTTPIKKITFETKEEVRFETNNGSTYTFRW